MAKKIQKKGKAPAKASKPVKASKPAKNGLGSALKKAAKSVAAKVIGKQAKAAKKVPVKETKKDKKALKPKEKIVAAPASAKLVKKVVEVSAPPPAAKGKKKNLLLEVPAPKGVALLSKDGKKKSKSSGDATSQSASSRRRCKEPACDQEGMLQSFCRAHYIKNWRKIKRKEAILASGQLNNYVEELVSKYPEKYLEVIRQDLSSEKDWSKVVVDLELESSEEDGGGDEDMDGIVSEGGTRREREFDDEGDAF